MPATIPSISPAWLLAIPSRLIKPCILLISQRRLNLIHEDSLCQDTPLRYYASPVMARFVGLPGAFPRYLRLLRTQYWHPEKLRKYIDNCLHDSITAARRIPFYRERSGGHEAR